MRDISTGFSFKLASSGGSRQIQPDVAIKRHQSRMAMTLLSQWLLLGQDAHGSFSLASTTTNMFAVSLGALLDGIAAGAFFLVKSHPRDQKQDGLGKFFQLNHELITFDGPKDLLRKIRYYLDNEQERQRISKAARERLLAGHTCRHRAREMLETITAD